jgi:hypothetical protein
MRVEACSHNCFEYGGGWVIAGALKKPGRALLCFVVAEYTWTAA